jgi:hypothetical protein
MASNRFVSPKWLVLFVPFAFGCGKTKQSEVQAPAYEVDNSEDSSTPEGMGMMAEIGGLNEEKVSKTFKRLQPEFTKCLMSGLSRVEFLAGEVQFLVEVDLEGHAQGAFIEHSTLGDFETENCMVDQIKNTRWPKPVGGKIGLARSGLAFETPPDVRPPVSWSSDDVADTLSKSSSSLASCVGKGPYEITAYVSRDGSVMSAGVAFADAESAEGARCYIEQLKGLKFSSPGSWPAKVSFKR